MKHIKEKIGESVRVWALFEQSKVTPLCFEWRQRPHKVQVTYRWDHLAGRALMLHFAVTDGASLFELAYDTAGQSWTLEGMEAVDG